MGKLEREIKRLRKIKKRREKILAKKMEKRELKKEIRRLKYERFLKGAGKVTKGVYTFGKGTGRVFKKMKKEGYGKRIKEALG